MERVASWHPICCFPPWILNIKIKILPVHQRFIRTCTEYGSSSESDNEGVTVEQTWHGDGDSDAESVDSEQEDPLK